MTESGNFTSAIKADAKTESRNDKMKKGVMSLLFVFVWGVMFVCAVCHKVEAEPLDYPSLSTIVFVGLRPAKELDLAMYAKPGQPCLRKYLDSIPPESFLWDFEVPSSPDQAVPVKRRNLIEQMVVIIGQHVRKEAEAFGYAVPLTVEWEGMSEGPLEEANFVDNWLKSYPETAIAPFLNLFKAYRLRAGYEAAQAGHEKGLWPILSKRYREALAQARATNIPLISCIADDLEAQEYVYLKGQGVRP